MMHGGGGVLLMKTTKFASQETNEKYKVTKNVNNFLFLISNLKHKITSKNNNANKHPAPSNKLNRKKKTRNQCKKTVKRLQCGWKDCCGGGGDPDASM